MFLDEFTCVNSKTNTFTLQLKIPKNWLITVYHFTTDILPNKNDPSSVFSVTSIKLAQFLRCNSTKPHN